ncbi:MAG TPA: acetate/propionate family kinase [Aliidongia sp.]|uniref:acetate/propionate family kinase n=1 Tax=Aliidongia sp. TaxID=1914230 RepID=UPI002DDCDBD7|nr:acetate/propionate family kinase [Aliidongia sp.]HEV2677339.1 acetate/propionate family kinase [Aliidongia sp.]
MPNAILALNAGSSSIKFGLFEITDTPHRIARGEIGGIGTAPHFVARDAGGAIIGERRWPDASANHEALLGGLLEWIEAHLGQDTLVAVGHRVVHGGRDFTGPVRLDDKMLAALDLLTPLAPLHQPHSLSPVRALMAVKPGLPQVACFDTSFHHTLPAVATRFALPRAYEAEGIRRYGFHGLSYEYVAGALRRTAPWVASGRVIVAHLGNGASLCAMRDGISIDTTMGFTALDGLMMGTRCGTIDPGVILYMLQQKRLAAAEVETLLYQRSGLLGVSGLSSDMRVLLESSTTEAREAIELFVFRIAREAAALAGSLGGLDGFVFTAGIGEHAAEIRAAVCARLAWLGVAVSRAANTIHADRISTRESRVEVRVIPTDEEAMIVRHTLETI